MDSAEQADFSFSVQPSLSEHSVSASAWDNLLSDVLVEDLIFESELPLSRLESTNVSFLQKVFDTTQDPQIMNLIVQTLINEYQFVNAKQFIEGLSAQQLTQLDPLLHLQVLFNSFSLSSPNALDALVALVDDYYGAGSISLEQKNWYYGVTLLMRRNYTGFFDLARTYQQLSHTAVASRLTSLQQQISKQSDMPLYYFDALVGVELFNQGFFQASKVLALYVLGQDKNYILPYQLLAYANFLTASWDASVEYLYILLSLDAAALARYDFLMGIAYYWNEDYERSVLKLSQVKNVMYSLDVDRYLVLNYLKLGQVEKLLSAWQRVLGHETLQTSDFFNYFYEVFFLPYSKGDDYMLYTQNPRLAENYLVHCFQVLQGAEQAVCEYGSIGLSLAKGQLQ